MTSSTSSGPAACKWRKTLMYVRTSLCRVAETLEKHKLLYQIIVDRIQDKPGFTAKSSQNFCFRPSVRPVTDIGRGGGGGGGALVLPTI